MDPHQRILLEETLHCIEDSGVPLTVLQEKKTAVYMGIGAFDVLKAVGEEHRVINGYTVIGTYPGLTVNKVSYHIGLSGPSYSVDAACASSLVALDNAKKTLLSQESHTVLHT